MIKKLIFTIAFLLSLYFQASAEKAHLFPPLVSEFPRLVPVYFGNDYVIPDSISVDSLNKIIYKQRELDNVNKCGENFASYINLSGLNENQIDSIIHMIDYKPAIIGILFKNCKIKKLPDSVKTLQNLSSIKFFGCDSIMTLNGFDSYFQFFDLGFYNCRIKKFPEGTDALHPLLRISMEVPDDFNGFDLNNELAKFAKRKNIVDLFVTYKLLNKFPDQIFELTMLQTLGLYTKYVTNYPTHFDKLNNLMYLFLSKAEDTYPLDSINAKVVFCMSPVYSDNREEYIMALAEFLSQVRWVLYPEIMENQPSIFPDLIILPNYDNYVFATANIDSHQITIKAISKPYLLKLDGITNLEPKDSVKVKLMDEYQSKTIFEDAYNGHEITMPLGSDNIYVLIITINGKVKKLAIYK